MHQTDIANPQSTSIFSTLPPYDSLFWRPRYIIDSPIAEHVVALFWLASVIRPISSAVVGAGDGVAHFTLCQAIDKLNLPGRCRGLGFWYDPQKKEFAYKAPKALCEHAAHLYEDVSELRGFDTNQAALNSIAPLSLDLLFVDLKNLADGDAPQLAELLRCLRAGGTLILHGTNEVGGLHSSLEQLIASLSEHQMIKFDKGDGLTIIHNDNAAHPQLTTLLNPTEQGAIPQEIELLFRRLGQGLVFQARHKAVLDQINDLTRKLEDAESAKRFAERACAEISIVHEDRNRKIWGYQSSIHDLRQQVTLLMSIETELNEKLNEKVLEAQNLTRKLRELEEGQAQNNVHPSEVESLLEQKNSEIRKVQEVHYNETALLTKALEAARVQLDQAHGEVIALRKSTSWRLTAPLRLIKLRVFTRR